MIMLNSIEFETNMAFDVLRAERLIGWNSIEYYVLLNNRNYANTRNEICQCTKIDFRLPDIAKLKRFWIV